MKDSEIIVNHYTNNFKEETRFDKFSGKVEFLTNMHYIKKFLHKGDKILELGAGTGAYSLALAKEGFEVVAVDLVPRNVEIMKKRGKKYKNFSCFVGNALDLSFLKNNSFDMVLNLGVMYHLFSKKDKKQAIAETLRVCKKGGIAMFAYLTNASVVCQSGIRKGQLLQMEYAFNKDFSLKDIPSEVFSSYYIEDFKKQFEHFNVKYIANVASDGISSIMCDYIDEKFNKKSQELFLKWHFATCERLDQQGYSSHCLYICKKR